MMIFV